MELGLSVGMSERMEQMGAINREPSLSSNDNAARDAKEDHPSLRLELKLPWSEAGDGFDNGQIDEHTYSGCEMWPSPAAPLSIKTEGPHWRSCDEDDGTGQTTRKKLRLTKEQSCYLEQSFKEQSTLNPKQKLSIAKKLNLQPRQVEVWFQNRRARTKLKQTEIDFEHIKRRCDSLIMENQKLHRELEELKELKFPLPRLLLRSPAAMLALCPSCERATTSDAAGKKLGGLRIHLKHGENFCTKLAYQVG